MNYSGRILHVLVVSDKRAITNILILTSEERALDSAILMIRNKASHWGLSQSIADNLEFQQKVDLINNWQHLTEGMEKIQIFQSPINEE